MLLATFLFVYLFAGAKGAESGEVDLCNASYFILLFDNNNCFIFETTLGDS